VKRLLLLVVLLLGVARPARADVVSPVLVGGVMLLAVGIFVLAVAALVIAWRRRGRGGAGRDEGAPGPHS